MAIPMPNEISKSRSTDQSAANYTPGLLSEPPYPPWTQEPDNQVWHRSTTPPATQIPSTHSNIYNSILRASVETKILLFHSSISKQKASYIVANILLLRLYKMNIPLHLDFFEPFLKTCSCLYLRSWELHNEIKLKGERTAG